MLSLLLAAATAASTSVALAKECINITIPVTLSGRNGVFGGQPRLVNDFNVTTFSQNFTSIKANYTAAVTTNYTTNSGSYDIAARLCTPTASTPENSTVQVLTHGLGFDRTYWELPLGTNYSYVDWAVDKYGFSTLAYDRLCVGNSSHPDPYDVCQLPAELSVLNSLTTLLRSGPLPGTSSPAFGKVVHVGHSYGSALSYSLAAAFPNNTDGLVLTGYSQNATWLPATVAAWNQRAARFNQPARFGDARTVDVAGAWGALMPYAAALNLSLAQPLVDASAASAALASAALASAGFTPAPAPAPLDLDAGYLTWADVYANQYTFLYPPFFAAAVGALAEAVKQPYTVGEVLTLGAVPPPAPLFAGPVLVLTGRQDEIYCGGDCLATGRADVGSVPEDVGMMLPNASVFEVAIHPNSGHAINLHYNATGSFMVISNFLKANGL